MPSPKPSPERKSRSGSYVPNDLRGTVRVEIRCSPEIASWVRRVAREHSYTLAEILEAGADAVAEGESPAAGPIAPTRDEEAAYHADLEYERMRDDDIREGR